MRATTAAGLWVASVLLLVSGCAAAPATPAPELFPTVLSTTTSDSGRTVTATALTAELEASQAQRPAGFRGVSVVVAHGLGSFDVAVPRSYRTVWRVGTPPDELLAEAARRDPGWAAEAKTRLTRATTAGSLRAVALDGDPGGVVALSITVNPAPPESGDALAERMRQEFSAQGRSVTQAHGVRVNGADGAYVELGIPASPQGSAVPRVAMQVRIPDPPNTLQWSLTCDVPASRAAELRKVCAEMAAGFRPLPTVSG